MFFRRNFVNKTIIQFKKIESGHTFILPNSLNYFFLYFSCDADPAALAKYVIALAKKDKPQPELKALCEDQLDVFLGDGMLIFFDLDSKMQLCVTCRTVHN